MLAQTITQAHWFKIVLAVSLVLAYLGWTSPARRMPPDFHTMLWWSIPLACVWALTVGLSAHRFGRKALWMLLGAPLALYWPVWLAFHGIPSCYWHGNCV